MLKDIIRFAKTVGSLGFLGKIMLWSMSNNDHCLRKMLKGNVKVYLFNYFNIITNYEINLKVGNKNKYLL